MATLDCQHDAAEAGRVCAHLLQAPDADYVHAFTGEGRAFHLICQACAAAAEGERPYRSACAGCFAHVRDEGCWEGIRGRPEVFTRPSELHFTQRTVRLAGLGDLLDVRPVEAFDQELWVAVARSGELLLLDLDSGSVGRACELPLGSAVELNQPVSLRLSRDGRLAAVVNTKGRSGVVIDLATGRATLALDRGDYHNQNCDFPVAFAEHDGRAVVIHGTAWNRLDVSDARTGELRTARSQPPYRQGDPRPEHYLDYFHCGLTLSPDGEYIAEDGWVWSPVGVVAAWSVRRWLGSNVWESEDGESRKWLCDRAYHWDGPMCWVGEDQLAVWGYGRDGDWLLPAVRLFDVRTGLETGWFAGPIGELAHDRYLFSFGGRHAEPMQVWDVETGERLLEDRSFSPSRYHRGAKSFLTVRPDGAFKLSRLRGRPIDPGWLTGGGGAVARVAAGIREARDFDSLPVLADALEEAGCQDAEALAHCRRPGPHGSACWVLDWLLERG